ncbi:hypothetical protein MAR_015611 [Mya arenaria]|uniref:Uncharacterized protein n=1 Tax=Mya arenaria TaxID=6604 RepID=A0ABY7FHN6_MYAAR|nr:hypothetical protein MAR_015611 [Mya arenaria]
MELDPNCVSWNQKEQKENMVLRKVKRQLKLLLIAGVLFIVVVSLKLSLDQTNIFLPFDGSVDLSFRQLLQADMTWTNSRHAHFQLPGRIVEPNGKSNIDPKTTQKPQPLVKISDGYNLATRIRDKCAGPASRNSSAKSTARLSLRQPQLGTYRSGGTELCIIWKLLRSTQTSLAENANAGPDWPGGNAPDRGAIHDLDFGAVLSDGNAIQECVSFT